MTTRHQSKFVSYIRVSTARQGRSGLGLEQRFDRHPVDAGTTRILSNTLQRGQKVPALTRHLHQAGGSRSVLNNVCS